MKIGTLRTVALAASALIGVSAQAAPTFSNSQNGIFFQNYENLYRATNTCGAGECLAQVDGDPAGYSRIDPNRPNNVRVGDVFVGVLQVQNIEGPTGDVWNQTNGDRFNGYFVQGVTSIANADPTKAVITLGTAVDPFGILAAGEMFRLYAGPSSLFTGGGTDVSASIASVTSNTLWASLGLGAEGYAYTNTDLTTNVYASNTEAFLGLDVLLQGPAYNLGGLFKINDHNEADVGGVAAAGAGQICTAADLASASIRCTDIVGTSEIEANNNFGAYPGSPGTSPWMFASNDPFELNQIPEPGTLALVGLALGSAGFAASRRRRN